MAVKRLVTISILEGEETVLVQRYPRFLSESNVVFLDGVRFCQIEIDQNDLLNIPASHPLWVALDAFTKNKPMRLQEATLVLKKEG